MEINPLNQKRWQVAEPLPAEADLALSEYDPLLRQLLFGRGCQTAQNARHYIGAVPPEDTDPFLMRGMAEAVERLQHAIRRHERMAIYGDYDVDGVTATALLTGALRRLGADVEAYIPNRFEEGYGLNIEALRDLKESGIGLVVTVDNGIRSVRESEYAAQIGLDLIISDHHHPLLDLPPALAVIDPKQQGDAYPDKNLAGVGVAYKIIQALLRDGDFPSSIAADDYLDLVALGTVADIVPLIGENRALVRRGLARLQRVDRQGLLSLMRVAGLKPENLNAGQIGFALGPRINAAGRLDSAVASLNLLMTEDIMEAGLLAQQLNVQNLERQRLTREILEHADQIARQDDPEGWLLFAVHPDFNAGVVGLVASRLSETYYRPAIIGEVGAEYTVASCRSIPEFHITDALDQCADLLVRHGGHAAAAGFKIHNDNIPALVERLQEIAARRLAPLSPQPTLFADMEIPLARIKPKELLYDIGLLEPTGNQNPEAVFISRDVSVRSSRQVGHDSRHLKLTLSDGSITYDAIAFSLGHLRPVLPLRVDVMYTFEVNDYNGRSTLQLNLKDIKPSDR